MRHAFSLVELSIVLVILGLLTGGILAGQSLIRASEIRSVVSDYTRYATATSTFREKYRGLPGDLMNATSFWGAAHATPATCGTTASTTAATCNGDGDGRIESNSCTSAGNEYFRFWQHLANAGLIEGSYSGVTGPGHATDDVVVGTNSPKSKLSDVTYSVWSPMACAAAVYPAEYNFTGLLLDIGKDVANDWNYDPAFTNEEAWSIDTKLDDGKPGYGMVRTGNNTAYPNCASTDVASTAAYQTTLKSKECMLTFQMFP